LIRYKQVDVVRVPKEAMDGWVEYNKEKCEADALMPKFSCGMRFAVLTKTHFCNANKLIMDGNRTLFNEGKIPIVVDTVTTEGAKIIEEGVLCSVYSEELWKDEEALLALMNADNDDADIEMAEDDIQAQGRVESALRELCKNTTPNVDELAEAIFKALKRSGLRAFNEEHTRAFITFRMGLTPQHANCFRALVFHEICGRVSLHPHDYATVATMDVRAPWLKIAILIYQYMFTRDERFLAGHEVTVGAFTGRKTATAKKLQASGRLYTFGPRPISL
jgi:hypothetical protein